MEYELRERESKLPKDRRYIHSMTELTTVQGGQKVKIVATGSASVLKDIHTCTFLAIDFTFKRIAGDTNEWEVASMLEKYSTRKYPESRCLRRRIVHSFLVVQASRYLVSTA